MVLQCECGGALEITENSYDRDSDGNITEEGSALEVYECVSCGRTGTYRFGDGGESTSGCVTSAGAY